MNPTTKLSRAGPSLWLDNGTRDLAHDDLSGAADLFRPAPDRTGR
jgi:hypothetical protein